MKYNEQINIQMFEKQSKKIVYQKKQEKKMIDTHFLKVEQLYNLKLNPPESTKKPKIMNNITRSFKILDKLADKLTDNSPLLPLNLGKAKTFGFVPKINPITTKKIEKQQDTPKRQMQFLLKQHILIHQEELEHCLKYRENRSSVSVSNFTHHFRMLGKDSSKVTLSPMNHCLTRSSSTNKIYQDKVMDKIILSEKQIYNKKNQEYKILSGVCNYKLLTIHSQLVSGYTVDSQMGTIKAKNNIRVSIAPYLIKSANQDKSISFFGLYEGRNGVQKAEYMRQYFHHLLVADGFIYYNFERSLVRAFERLERDMKYDRRLINDYSTVDFIICMIVGNNIFLIKSGGSNCSLSKNFGLHRSSMKLNRKKYNIIDCTHKNSLFSQQSPEGKTLAAQSQSFTLKDSIFSFSTTPIQIKSLQVNKDIDFILIANEGIYENILQPAKILWRNYLEDSNNINSLNFIQKLGKSATRLCDEAANKDIMGRTMTSVIISFQNIQKCTYNQCNRNNSQSEDSIQLPKFDLSKKHSNLEGENRQI